MSISSIDTIPAVSIIVYVLDERSTVGSSSMSVREERREGGKETERKGGRGDGGGGGGGGGGRGRGRGRERGRGEREREREREMRELIVDLSYYSLTIYL